MEYQTVFKSCVLRDTTPFVQSQNQLVTDDGLDADDVFPVDDLLIDFSNEGGGGERDDEGSFQKEEELGNISYYDEGGVFDEGTSDLINFSSQLAVPDDDLAELEWVSHFVDDSLHKLPVLNPIKPLDLEPGSMNRSEPGSVEHPRFSAHVPVKARSKRLRPPVFLLVPAKMNRGGRGGKRTVQFVCHAIGIKNILGPWTKDLNEIEQNKAVKMSKSRKLQSQKRYNE